MSNISIRLWIFLLVFIFSISISFISAFTSYRLRINQAVDNLKSNMIYHIDFSTSMLMRDIQGIKNMLNIAVNSLEMKENSMGDVEEYMKVVSMTYPDVMQFRLINKKGFEILRYERQSSDGEIVKLPNDKLQDKSSRDYFKYAMNSKKNDMVVTDIDLNIEHGVIETPFKPTIRFAKPYSLNGEVIGVVVINYFAEYFLSNFKPIDILDVYLTNKDGFYILHPDKNLEFSKYQTSPSNIKNEFPDVNIDEPGLNISSDQRTIGKRIDISDDNYLYALYKINGDYLRNIHIQQFALSVALYIISIIFSFFFSFYISRLYAAKYNNKVKEVDSNKAIIDKMESRVQELNKNIYVDPLTKARNRRFFNEKLAEIVSNSSEYGFIIADIDHFKKINDDFGHVKGDDVLIILTQIFQKNIRDTDYLIRWGGEEFCVLITDTKLKALKLISEKLRKGVASTDFGINRTVTCSFGFSLSKEGESPTAVFERADKALYKAKETGRNKVVSG